MAMTLKCDKTILIERREYEGVSYLRFAGESGEFELNDPQHVLAQVPALEPLSLTVELTSRFFSGKTRLGVVRAEVVRAK